MGLIVALAAAAGALLAEDARAWWGGPHRAWWEREVGARLVRLGWGRYAALHRVPALLAVLLLLLGGVAYGPLGALAGAGLGGGAWWGLPRLLDARIAARRDRADEHLTRVLPEIASAIGRGESPDVLLDRLVRLVGEEGRGQFDPLVPDLFRRAAAAARFTPRVPNLCRVFAASELPTARLVAVAWGQLSVGAEVPRAIRAIAKVAAEDHALREELRGRIEPIRRQARLMLFLPLGTLGLLVLQDPSLAPRLAAAPAVYFLFGSGVATVFGWAYLRTALGRLR